MARPRVAAVSRDPQPFGLRVAVLRASHSAVTRLVDISDRIELSGIEQQEWNRRLDEARLQGHPRIADAVWGIGEEAAALRMIAPPLAQAIDEVTVVAWGMEGGIGDAAILRETKQPQEVALARLWRIANGDEPSAST